MGIEICLFLKKVDSFYVCGKYKKSGGEMFAHCKEMYYLCIVIIPWFAGVCVLPLKMLIINQ